MNNKIKQRRLEMGLSQTDLARELGITISWLSKLENDKKRLTLALAARMAKILDCEINYFFD